MIHTIKNDSITVEISTLGAELQSIKATDGTEFLWQGDGQYWSGRAYNLFPICGRLTGGKYTYQGKTYEMNLHGFARKSQYTVAEQRTDYIAFSLKENPQTLEMYPFAFELLLSYQLEGASVRTTFTVRNTDQKELIFAVGGHPGFNVPFGADGTVFTDYYLEFDCEKPVQTIVMSPTCYTTRATQPLALQEGKILPLAHNLFDNDALVLSDMCKAVTLKNTKNERFVRLEYPDMNYVGLWHKPCCEAPYICIEPWTSVPAYEQEVDDLETKRDMQRLAPGGEYKNSFKIQVK